MIRIGTRSKILLWVVALTSLYSLIVTPPFQSPDEADHFKRIVQLGSGRFKVVTPPSETSGDHLDKSVMRVIEPFMHLPHRRDQRVNRSHLEQAYRGGELSLETEFVSFPGSLSYAPWSYPGQVLGYWIGSIFTDNMLLRFYASRIGAWALALLLLYFSLRLLPVERWPLLSLILIAAPFAMFQMGAAVPDSLLIPGTVLFCVGCAAVRQGQLSPRYLVLFSMLLFMIVGSKPPMALFYALVLAVLLEFRHKLSTHVWVLGGVLLFFAFTALWFDYALPRIENLRTEGVTTLAQQSKATALIAEPFRYVFLSLKVFIERIWGLYSSLYGEMGSLDASVPKLHIAIGRLLFLWALFVSLIPLSMRRFRIARDRTRWVDFVPLWVGVAYIVGVMIALYLTWAQPGSEHMGSGVQGRYFYPVLALPFFSMLGPSKTTRSWQVFFWVAIINAPVAMLLTLISRYYQPL